MATNGPAKIEYVSGDVVQTVFGAGVVTQCPSSSSSSSAAESSSPSSAFYEVLLWRLPGKAISSTSVAYLRHDALIRKLPAAPGMVTRKHTANKDTNGDMTTVAKTNYMVQAYYAHNHTFLITPIVVNDGQGDFLEENDLNSPRNRGESMSVAAAASRRLSRLSVSSQFIGPNAVSSPIAAAATTTTTTTVTAGMTSTARANHDTTSSSSTPIIEDEIVAAHELELAPSAIFYPMLLQLMRRGDVAAAATKEFFQDEKVSSVVSKAKVYTENQAKNVLTIAGTKMNEASDKLKGGVGTKSIPDDPEAMITDKVKSVANNEEVQQLIAMLKKEDLTVLLERGRHRLEQLLEQSESQMNELPEVAIKALYEKTGIKITLDDDIEDDSNSTGDSGRDLSSPKGTSKYKVAIMQSRKAALDALNKVLQQADVDPNDLQSIQATLSDNFGSMLESLEDAAKSDRALANMLDGINSQTAAWQEATGRLLATRSASIFLEGASRIHARAANLFSKDQLQWAGEIGSKFTKAFTEGDAAVARLKTIELGDQVRDRLVSAIEVRSESLGGLDGIIAGALTSLNVNDRAAAAKSASTTGGDQMKSMLTTLQSRATSVSKDAHETLISVLSRRSEYRDVALLQIEQVMCNLKSQFGQDLSPEDIASIAQGEGGTAKLFEPIAKRAAKEIEKQLDVAESSVADPTILGVLKHVRKIVSGEMSLNSVLDEVVNILNNDEVVAAGENIVKHGEQVLDAIEGVNANKVMDDVMNIAEKAGITKDSVMEGIEKLNVNELLDNAGNAITDESARRKLLSDATDTALDFILRVLPSMPVPPVEGVKDGLVYHISNLSMEGFRVRKESIIVEIAGMRATKKHKKPTVTIEEVDSSTPPGLNPDLQPQTSISSVGSFDSQNSQGMDLDTSVDGNVVVKATELLIIDVTDVSAMMNDVDWSFEQTYMPYLKGSGMFDVKMSGGAIRLVFELRKRPKDQPGTWEPVLCLHDRSCSIGSVDFNMQGNSRIAWVINKVASVFKNLLRDYIVRTILRILTDKSGWMLSKLNQGLSPFWDVLLRTAKLTMDDLAVATHKDIVEASPEPETTLIELVWRERLPLGMNLLLNDESGQLKVVDFPRGSQARTVCEKRNLDPELFKGATIIAVNGIKYVTEDDLFDALRDPGRPKTIQFALAESEDAERIRKFVEESQAMENPSPKKRPTLSASQRKFELRKVEFIDDMDLGIEFANSYDNTGLVVRKFLESDDGLVLAAARQKDKIKIGDILTHVNGEVVLGENGAGRIKALKLLEAIGSRRPLTLTFADPYLHLVGYYKSPSLPYSIGGPSTELILKEDKDAKRILLDGFNDVDGVAEKAGVMLGDHLVFVNGITVGAACRWMGERNVLSLQQVQEMLQDPSNYPIGLTFARPRREQDDDQGRGGWSSTLLLGGGPSSSNVDRSFSLENSETICVTGESTEQLGLDLELKSYTDIVVKDLEAIPGPIQVSSQFLRDVQTESFDHLAIDSVNGEFVPSFATPQMVKSAMDRAWRSDQAGSVEILYCDDHRKGWVLDMIRSSPSLN